MKKNISRNPLWPDWYNGKKIDEVQFGRAFLEQWPLKCVNGTLYTLDGPVEDESEIKQRILENIEEYVTSGLSKKVTNILETIKLLAFSDPFPIEQDCIHLQNGVYHLPDGTFQESRLFCQNRLPVKYDPKAPSPDRWLTFLHELLDDADIPTLQEYLGYCLIPSTKGQKMMLIVGKGGEGKSRIGLVLKRLMGDAASNGSVQKVENNRFARADLERRLLMIDDDMDMNALPKTNYIKTIVTAEAKLDLERKGVQSYQRDIYARFLCFGNGALTSLYDHSDGFFRRQLILTTKDKPADRTDDPFLVEKMCAELEGILLWCLEGLHRLVQNDFRFTVSERAAANVDTIKPARWPQGAGFCRHRTACPPLPVKSAFFHGRSSYNLYGLYLYAPVRQIEIKLRRVIVYISDFRTPYEPYRLFELRTRFFQMRTEQSSSHCANLIVTLPQETFPLGESSKSPLHFADHRDESVIVGYYTSAEVHLRSPSPLDEP